MTGNLRVRFVDGVTQSQGKRAGKRDRDQKMQQEKKALQKAGDMSKKAAQKAKDISRSWKRTDVWGSTDQAPVPFPTESEPPKGGYTTTPKQAVTGNQVRDAFPFLLVYSTFLCCRLFVCVAVVPFLLLY